MTFEEAERTINSIPRFTQKHGQTAMEAYLDALGSPDLSGSRVIHIAGTNGKGSTACYLSHCLQEAGYHVATFISPHLVTMRERMLFDGEMIGEDDFVRLYEAVQRTQRERGFTPPTFFEYLFLMMELFAAEKRPDWVVLETGLGGRLDATNSVRRKDLAVITRIGMDHMQILGDTIEQIAAEKAGILRPGVPAVVLDAPEEALGVFKRKAAELGTPLHVVHTDGIRAREAGRFVDFSYDFSYNVTAGAAQDPEETQAVIQARLRSPALYQAENAALAALSVRVLNAEGAGISDVALKRGLEGAYWPGRMEEVLPGFFVDGAHNRDGMRAFLETVRRLPRDTQNGRRLLVYAAMRDKAYAEELDMIRRSGLFDALVLVPLASGRALSEKELQAAAEAFSCPVRILTEKEGTREAVRLVRHFLAENPGSTAFAAGSLYLVGEIRAVLEG